MKRIIFGALFIVFFGISYAGETLNKNAKISAFLDKYNFPQKELSPESLESSLSLFRTRDYSQLKAAYVYGGKAKKNIEYCNELDEPTFIKYFVYSSNSEYSSISNESPSVPTLYKVIAPSKGAMSSTVVLADKKEEYKKIVANFGNPSRITPDEVGDGRGELDRALIYNVNHHGSPISVRFVVYWTGCLVVDVSYNEAFAKFEAEEKAKKGQRNEKAGRGITDALK